MLSENCLKIFTNLVIQSVYIPVAIKFNMPQSLSHSKKSDHKYEYQNEITKQNYIIAKLQLEIYSLLTIAIATFYKMYSNRFLPKHKVYKETSLLKVVLFNILSRRNIKNSNQKHSWEKKLANF